jgi:protein-S-isoprenylcysteine O-methyltransferase Ste14
VGTGVLLGTVAPFVVVPAFVWWITRRFIIHEEAMLEAKFGDIYKTYKRSVRRWI